MVGLWDNWMRAGLNLQPQEAHRFHVWTLNSDPIDPLCCEEHRLVSVTHTHTHKHTFHSWATVWRKISKPPLEVQSIVFHQDKETIWLCNAGHSLDTINGWWEFPQRGTVSLALFAGLARLAFCIFLGMLHMGRGHWLFDVASWTSLQLCVLLGFLLSHILVLQQVLSTQFVFKNKIKCSQNSHYDWTTHYFGVYCCWTLLIHKAWKYWSFF